MKILIALLFAVVHVSLQEEECSTLNAVRLKGYKYAGLVEVCRFYVWRPVCGDDWTNTSAGVICRQLNYTDPEHQDHVAYGYRCFDRTNVSSLAIHITCGANYSNFLSCSIFEISSSQCQATAGLFCDIAYSSPRINTPETAPSSSPNTNSHLSSMTITGTPTTTITLTVFIASLILILIGVVLGWVCTCYKWARNPHRFPACSNNNEISNTTYDPDAKLKMNFYRENKSGQNYKANANNENHKNQIQQGKTTAITDSKSSAENATYDSITSTHEASINKSHDNSYNIVNSVYEKSTRAVTYDSIPSTHEATINKSHDDSYNIINSVYEKSARAV